MQVFHLRPYAQFERIFELSERNPVAISVGGVPTRKQWFLLSNSIGMFLATQNYGAAQNPGSDLYIQDFMRLFHTIDVLGMSTHTYDYTYSDRDRDRDREYTHKHTHRQINKNHRFFYDFILPRGSFPVFSLRFFSRRKHKNTFVCLHTHTLTLCALYFCCSFFSLIHP